MSFLSLAEVLRLNVWAMRPEMISKGSRLMARSERELGLTLFVRNYGGWRGDGIQAQLVAWRNEADKADGIIGSGRDYYAVAPVGQSHHEAGAAIDFGIADPKQRTIDNYRKVADLSRDVGLVPGFYFRKRDEFHHQLPDSLHDAVERWRMMMRARAAVVAVGLLVFFFPTLATFA